MEKMRMILRLLMLLLAMSGSLSAQSDILDFIDPDNVMYPELLMEDWMDRLLYPDTSKTMAGSLNTSSWRMQGIVSTNLTSSTKSAQHRLRILAEAGGAVFSGLAQNGHQTSGIGVTPDRDHVAMYFGDFQYDYGLGLIFSSRRSFRSWTQEPHQQMYRSRGFKVNSSSDTIQFLRGGGCSILLNDWKLDGFFSLRSEGFGLEHQGEKMHYGVLLTRMDFLNERGTRSGLYVKAALPGSIISSEIAIQSDQAFAVESNLSYFGSDIHRFLITLRYYSRGFYPVYSKLSFTKPAETGLQELTMNYMRLLQKGWTFQMYADTKGSLEAKANQLNPSFKWNLKAGLRWDDRSGSHFFGRIFFTPGEMGFMLRYRSGTLTPSSYWQFELGWNVSDSFSGTSFHNRYLGFDHRLQIPAWRLAVISGFCVHQGDEGSPLLYRYEPDLFYQMSLPVLSGKGFRGYVNLSWKIRDDLQLEGKVQKRYYLDRSDQDQQLVTVKLQLIYRPRFTSKGY